MFLLRRKVRQKKIIVLYVILVTDIFIPHSHFFNFIFIFINHQARRVTTKAREVVVAQPATTQTRQLAPAAET